MVGPRTIKATNIFGYEIEVLIYQKPQFLSGMRRETTLWSQIVEKSKLKADVDAWTAPHPTRDAMYLKALLEKWGEYDVLQIKLHEHNSEKISQSVLDIFIDDTQSYSVTEGERIYWSPSSAFFAIPRQKPFFVQMTDSSVNNTVKREFILQHPNEKRPIQLLGAQPIWAKLKFGHR